MKIIPVGLLTEYGLIEKYPDRRAEIIAHAIRTREQERLSTREVRGLLGWHPVQTAKVVILSGLVTFVLAWLLSELVAISHWYVSARTLAVTVPIPVIGNKVIDLGSHIPTSTTLTAASTFPVFGVRESAYAAIGVMALLLLEKVVMMVWHARESHRLGSRMSDLKQEIATLEEWKKRN